MTLSRLSTISSPHAKSPLPQTTSSPTRDVASKAVSSRSTITPNRLAQIVHMLARTWVKKLIKVAVMNIGLRHCILTMFFLVALFSTSPYTLPSLARRSVRDDWTVQKETVSKDIKEELLGAEVKLLANTDLIWKVFVDAKKVGLFCLTCILNQLTCRMSDQTRP